MDLTNDVIPSVDSPVTPKTYDAEDGSEGPSWGLIIPIIMIGVFLLCVVLCLWWHKWRDKRTLRIPRETTGSGSFQRSYRGGRATRFGFDNIRDSTKSTTPLRSSLNEKNNNNCPQSKMNNVNVIPIQRPIHGKYSLFWDKNHWRAVPTPTARIGTKALSPINEVDSPTSAKLSELSRNYEQIGTHPSYSPYHLTWLTSSNAPPSYDASETTSHIEVRQQSRSQSDYSPNPFKHCEPVVNSPFFPNNNTPTTECDTESEVSQDRHPECSNQTSECTSCLSSPTSNTVLSRTNHIISGSSGTDAQGTSMVSYYPESSSYQTSSVQSQSALQPSSLYNTRSTSATDHPSTNISSLPSSIAPFRKQDVLLNDPNNNSIVMPNANVLLQRSKTLNYTLASSLSSDTHVSDNTSMLPNIGSNNTSGYPTALVLRSGPQSTEPSGPASPEDLSKLVDEMSSIRPVDESSSIRPNTSVDPTPFVITTSGTSLSAGLQRSWSVVAEMEQYSTNSTNTSSQTNSQTDGSMYWDNYPLHGKRELSKSSPELPLHVYENHSFLGHVSDLNYHVPILMEEQYWV